MKRKIIAGIILLAGVCMLAYPVLGNIINAIRQENVQAQYEEIVQQMDEETKTQIKTDAAEYNEKLANGEISTASTDEDAIDGSYDDGSGYSSALDVGTEAFAFIKIPKINVELPVYKGTSELTLEKGIGHLRNTSLPVGGKSTHCVLTGHTGLPSTMLFTDLDKLEEGDMFYIKYLDEILAYKVDQIKIVEPTDTSELQIVPDKDYVTLLTCYPYGINSHRLLVRGERVAYTGGITFGDEETVIDETLQTQIQNDISSDSDKVSVYGYFVPLWLAIVIIALIIILIIVGTVISAVRAKRNEDAEARALVEANKGESEPDKNESND